MADHDEGYVIIERRTGNFGTFVWGLLLGAGAALLFAPKSGRETRQELGESAERLRGEAENRLRDVQHTVNATVDDVRRQFEEGIENARHAVESGAEAVRASRDEMERRMRESSHAFRSGYEAARTGRPAEETDATSPDAGASGVSDEADGAEA